MVYHPRPVFGVDIKPRIVFVGPNLRWVYKMFSPRGGFYEPVAVWKIKKTSKKP
jgi:hypothetical protein